MVAWGSTIAVVAVVAIFVALKATSKPAGVATASKSSTIAPASLVSAVTHVPAASFAKAGVGTSPTVTGPLKLPAAPALKKAGLPRIVFIGADYCPYCATERWALIAALSRFGTFSHLGITHSSTTDVFPGTLTFSFFGSSYKSPYLDFTPVETNTNTASSSGSYPVLQNPTTTENNLLGTYDVPPYVPSSKSDGSIPFVDYANQYLAIGATYQATSIQGLSRSQIAAQMTKATGTAGTQIDQAANRITAAVCQVTHDAPASVCSQPVVKAAAKTLKKAP